MKGKVSGELTGEWLTGYPQRHGCKAMVITFRIKVYSRNRLPIKRGRTLCHKFSISHTYVYERVKSEGNGLTVCADLVYSVHNLLEIKLFLSRVCTHCIVEAVMCHKENRIRQHKLTTTPKLCFQASLHNLFQCCFSGHFLLADSSNRVHKMSYLSPARLHLHMEHIFTLNISSKKGFARYTPSMDSTRLYAKSYVWCTLGMLSYINTRFNFIPNPLLLPQLLKHNFFLCIHNHTRFMKYLCDCTNYVNPVCWSVCGDFSSHRQPISAATSSS